MLHDVRLGRVNLVDHQNEKLLIGMLSRESSIKFRAGGENGHIEVPVVQLPLGSTQTLVGV
jgi:hypothetical protein